MGNNFRSSREQEILDQIRKTSDEIDEMFRSRAGEWSESKKKKMIDSHINLDAAIEDYKEAVEL